MLKRLVTDSGPPVARLINLQQAAGHWSRIFKDDEKVVYSHANVWILMRCARRKGKEAKIQKMFVPSCKGGVDWTE